MELFACYQFCLLFKTEYLNKLVNGGVLLPAKLAG